MKKSDFRHLIGGVVGGIIGILAFAWFGKVAMSIGCLGGSMVGFWSDALFSVTTRAWKSIFKGTLAKPQGGNLSTWFKKPENKERITRIIGCGIFVILNIVIFHVASLSLFLKDSNVLVFFFFFIIPLLFWAAAIIDAYRMAKTENNLRHELRHDRLAKQGSLRYTIGSMFILFHHEIRIAVIIISAAILLLSALFCG